MKTVCITRRLACALAAAVLTPLGAQAQALQEVTYLLHAPATLPAFGPWMLAQAKGYYKAEGLDVKFVAARGGVDVAKQVGAGNAVKWPTGVGGKGNEGVAANVQRVKGAFGYVEYAYAKRNKIPYGQMKNRDGEFVMPDDESFKAAAANADWANTPGMGVLLTNQPGAKSWPATGASFILMHKSQADALTGRAVLKFFDWAYKNGGQMATELEYVPIPAPVVKQIQEVWKASFKDSAGAPIWK